VHDLISFDSAFAVVESGRVAALLTLIDPFTREYRQRIVDFAAQRHLPAIYDAREFVQSGGLISYGPSLLAMQQRVAEYVDKPGVPLLALRDGFTMPALRSLSGVTGRPPQSIQANARERSPSSQGNALSIRVTLALHELGHR
jgi:hypothetical protein